MASNMAPEVVIYFVVAIILFLFAGILAAAYWGYRRTTIVLTLLLFGAVLASAVHLSVFNPIALSRRH